MQVEEGMASSTLGYSELRTLEGLGGQESARFWKDHTLAIISLKPSSPPIHSPHSPKQSLC